MLNPQALTAHLLARGLVSGEIIDRGLRIVGRQRRNRNFEVLLSRGNGYFTKETRHSDGSIAAEAKFYIDVVQTQPAAALARFVPRFCDFDPGAGILVLRLIKPATDFQSTIIRTRRIRQAMVHQLALAVATLHDLRPTQSVADSDEPWVLSLSAPGIEVLRDISAANVALLRIVQRSSALCRCFESLEESWVRETPIHGDLRFANCLVSHRSGATDRLRIVDWELCGLGDPAWDLGCVLAAFLALWIGSMPLLENSSPARRARSARVPLAVVQTAADTFWSAYAKGRHLSTNESAAILLRSVRFAAARLVQTAFEQLQYSADLHRTAVVLLQVAANIARKPRVASSALLGIELQ